MHQIKSFLVSSLALLVSLSSCAAPPATSSEPAPTIPPNIIFPAPPSCITIAGEPTPGPDEPSLFPLPNETDHILGPSEATVTLIGYTDYQDQYSGLFWDAVKKLSDEHPKDVRVVSRIFPLLATKDKSVLAGQAAQAAGEQGKFWEMHNLLFAQQQNWINLSVEDFEQWVGAQALDLGMNAKQFKSDLTRADIVAKIQQAWEEGQKIGLPGTPIVIINGQIYTGPRDFASLNDIVQLIVLGKRQHTSCPPLTVQKTRQYIATLHIDKGNVVIQLFADKAPITVNSFLFLARNGWYNNITFHRVIPDLFAQTGDPSGTGKGNPGYYVVTEITPSLTFNKPGVVAMVNSGPDTSGSQFFITYAPAAQFDGKYTIFGQVLSGMEILESLTPRDAQPGTEIPPGDKLLSVTIEEK
jgi:cyclophilin family peptidyl-prolyl cis-trans isomerase/protein-disulfide isomerase